MNLFWKNVRTLSADLDIKPETARKWQTRRFIPTKWHHPLMSLAEKQGKQLSWDMLLRPPSSDEAGK